MVNRRFPAVLLLAGLCATASASLKAAPSDGMHELFATSGNCVACHTGLTTAGGEDVSIADDWSASMMANAARDPYWQAAVRREVMDHPEAAAEIQHECSACHMPMARYAAKAAGAQGEVFAHLPFDANPEPMQRLAEDGVSCAMCHQIQPDQLGTEASFTAGFVVDESTPAGRRSIFGPYEIDSGRQHVMSSASRFEPNQGEHMQSSELCASCHTLYTHSLGDGGAVIGTLPEQMPYLEWQHSRYRETDSCQDCHMERLEQPTPISSVLGEPRDGFSRHAFRGGNFFMIRMLNRYRDELAVAATPQAMDLAARRTVEHLQSAAAEVSVEDLSMAGERLEGSVVVHNLAGHKLPTAYPSRRAWLHVTVQDDRGRTLFESGRLRDDGSIAGNDNDADADRFEQHFTEIRSADQVQVYEGILAGPEGEVTTGLLTAVRYAKDSRLLPEGFDKASAAPDVAVRGRAIDDDDFRGGGDRVLYSMDVGTAHSGRLTMTARLYYQPIAYRWAHNLAAYDAFETQRFLRYYRTMAGASAVVLAEATASLEP